MTAKPTLPTVNLTPLSIVKAVWNHKLVVASCWIVVAATVAVWVSRMPPVYSADALVQVESQRIPEKYVSATVNVDVQDRVSVLRQQLLSYSRLWSIIERFNLYSGLRRTHTKEEMVERMRKDIGITFERGLGVGRPGAFRVSYRGNDPALVARVTNLISNFFIDENLRSREVEAVGTSEFIENQLAEAKKRLEEQERQLSEYKTAHNGELPEQENALLSSLGQFKVQLMGIQDRITREQQNRLMLQASLESAQTSEAAMDRMETGPAAPARSVVEPVPVNGAAATVNGAAATAEPLTAERLRAQLAALRMRYTENHPDVKRVAAALKSLEDAEPQGVRQGRGAPVRPAESAGGLPRPQSNLLAMTLQERIHSLKLQISVATTELQSMEKEQQRLIVAITNIESRVQNLPIREQQLTSITRDYEMTKANYRSLLDKKMAADLAAEMERRQKAERFVMLELARTPEKPIQPKRGLLTGVGVVVGLMLGVVLAIGLELRKGVLLGEWELWSGVVILGRIPAIPDVGRTGSQRGGLALPGWRWPVTAALCALGGIGWLAYLLRNHLPKF